ncbi:MAG: signal peptide peptidase SppA [Deltaproteobacteria bacterium]|nr:MAG: signal peptide peptidase SppA [Deltaproteobacteria bacterium]
MFSRRHPFLFFILVLAGLGTFSTLFVSAMVAYTVHRSGLGKADSDLPRVGIVEVSGVLSDAKDVLADLKKMREDESIEAIVLRVDSPGGAVAPSQEVYRAVQQTTETKKIVASLGAVAASGGYYAVAASDGIVASPGTITGSIGVIMGFTNFRELLEKIGLTPVVIKSGEVKDLGSPVREMQPAEREVLQRLSDQIHHQFIRDIAEGRAMDLSRVEALADGRIYTGEEARALGLVDRLGNLEDAAAWAGELAGVQGPVEMVYAREKRLSLIKTIMESRWGEIFGLLFRGRPAALMDGAY